MEMSPRWFKSLAFRPVLWPLVWSGKSCWMFLDFWTPAASSSIHFSLTFWRRSHQWSTSWLPTRSRHPAHRSWRAHLFDISLKYCEVMIFAYICYAWLLLLASLNLSLLQPLHECTQSSDCWWTSERHSGHSLRHSAANNGWNAKRLLHNLARSCLFAGWRHERGSKLWLLRLRRRPTVQHSMLWRGVWCLVFCRHKIVIKWNKHRTISSVSNRSMHTYE